MDLNFDFKWTLQFGSSPIISYTPTLNYSDYRNSGYLTLGLG